MHYSEFDSDRFIKDSSEITGNETDEEITLLAIRDVALENRELQKRITRLESALRRIADHRLQNSHHADLERFTEAYADGIARGLKIAAEIAREAVKT